MFVLCWCVCNPGNDLVVSVDGNEGAGVLVVLRDCNGMRPIQNEDLMTGAACPWDTG